MLNDIPEFIEQLKKYFRFRNSRKRNQRDASFDNSLSVLECFFFLLFGVSYLVSQWLRAATERAIIKRSLAITTMETAINRITKGIFLKLEPRVHQLCRYHGNHILIGMLF